MGGIGGFLIAIWRWIFKALVEERDHYKDLSDKKDQEIDQLLVLDVKDNSYFESQGASNQHGQGAHLFAHDKNVMGWLFNQIKGGDEVEK